MEGLRAVLSLQYEKIIILIAIGLMGFISVGYANSTLAEFADPISNKEIIISSPMAHVNSIDYIKSVNDKGGIEVSGLKLRILNTDKEFPHTYMSCVSLSGNNQVTDLVCQSTGKIDPLEEGILEIKLLKGINIQDLENISLDLEQKS